MKQDFHEASRREFSRRIATVAEACSDIAITDRRESAERRKADRWVSRAIVIAERRALQKSKAAPYCTEQRL